MKNLDKFLQIVKFSLVESVYVRQSLFIRYLLKLVFNVKINITI